MLTWNNLMRLEMKLTNTENVAWYLLTKTCINFPELCDCVQNIGPPLSTLNSAFLFNFKDRYSIERFSPVCTTIRNAAVFSRHGFNSNLFLSKHCHQGVGPVKLRAQQRDHEVLCTQSVNLAAFQTRVFFTVTLVKRRQTQWEEILARLLQLLQLRCWLTSRTRFYSKRP